MTTNVVKVDGSGSICVTCFNGVISISASPALTLHLTTSSRTSLPVRVYPLTPISSR